MGLKTNLPFHQKLIDSTRFLAGRYDTQFVEQHLTMRPEEQEGGEQAEIAAILATLVEHRQRQQALQFTAGPQRNASHWKWGARR
ncbi:MAG: hypothetical protein HY866_19470, partial [Chloroflexi bacterium]|nr:hypothetical protein [Chloroflexota bacterium]